MTDLGAAAATGVAEVESRLYDTIDSLTEGTPMAEALETLRALASHFPAGEALARRRAPQGVLA